MLAIFWLYILIHLPGIIGAINSNPGVHYFMNLFASNNISSMKGILI